MASDKPRRMFRSDENKIFGGVLGGMGEYLDVDPVAIRTAYVIMAFLTGVFPMAAAYVALLFIVPKKPNAQ